VSACKELGVGIVAYSPVARGMLAGMVTSKEDLPQDWRNAIPYLTEENLEANLALVGKIEAMAKNKEASMAQLCIAWVIAKGAVPVPSTTNEAHVKGDTAAAAALELELTAEEMAMLEELGAQVKGERGDEGYMKRTFRTADVGRGLRALWRYTVPRLALAPKWGGCAAGGTSLRGQGQGEGQLRPCYGGGRARALAVHKPQLPLWFFI
jgi:hypothetical protein